MDDDDAWQRHTLRRGLSQRGIIAYSERGPIEARTHDDDDDTFLYMHVCTAREAERERGRGQFTR